MKTKRRLAAAALLVSMLLSLFSGGTAAAASTVTTGSELVYDPLAQASSVAYEQHDDGYTVSLDRAADSVTMNITGAPSTGAAPEKARLYVRTGVELKAGTTYQVSFALAADRAQSGYAVRFDGGSAEAAYGKLEGRSIQAGGTDRVQYQIAPSKDNGELVLCLLLGQTEGNALRFSDLAVEESSGTTAGQNTVVVDDLDYNAPGAIRFWTNDDCGATMSNDDSSATLTVTKVPAKGAEVWKIKLLVATGLMPQSGKTYRFRADVKASASGDYELCYNEGDTEKGYDVVYSQHLSTQKQTIERRIYVPSDNEDPGELIVQLSLGLLKAGDKVTVSNVRVEEAASRYTNVLAKDFAYDKTNTIEEYDPNNYTVTSAKDSGLTINYVGMTASSSGGTADGNPIVGGGSVTQKIKKPASTSTDPDEGTKAWNTLLNIDTGKVLKPKTTYRVSYKIKSDLIYNYEFQCGTGFVPDTPDNDKYYGGAWFRLNKSTVTYQFDSKDGGPLLLSLQLGETERRENTVTVSDITIEELTDTGRFNNSNIASVTYPDSINVREDGDFKGTLSGDGRSFAALTFIGGVAEIWQRGFFIDDICSLSGGSEYEVSFDITTDNYQVTFIKDREFSRPGHDEDNIDSNVRPEGPDKYHFSHTIRPDEDCSLYMRVECGVGAEDYQVVISDIKVEKADGGSVDYRVGYPFSPEVGTGSFKIEHDGNSGLGGFIIGDSEDSVTFICTGDTADTEIWMRRLWVKEFCGLASGVKYQVSFDIEADDPVSEWRACYNNNDDWSDGKIEDGHFGTETEGAIGPEKRTITHEVIPTAGDTKLVLRLDLGKVSDGNRVTVSNIKVQQAAYEVTDTQKCNFSSISSDKAKEATGWNVDLIKDPLSAQLNVTKGSASPENYYAKMFIHTGKVYTSNKAYRLTFDIVAEKSQNEFVVVAQGTSDDLDARGTWGLSLEANQPKTITTRAFPGKLGSGEVAWALELGRLDGDSNTFTISNVRVEEVSIEQTMSGVRVDGAVTHDAQSGYRNELTREKDSATLDILETPATGLEAWKSKLFIDTGVTPKADESIRVTFDVKAAEDMDFEVCYNRNNDEKGYDAIYGLHVAAGQTKRVEKVFTAAGTGKLKVQLSLGNVKGPNSVTVSGLKVEQISYAYSGQSALSNEISYRAPGAVSYWAHADYTTNFTSTGDSITANITSFPATGAEPWKIKLFLDTGAVLQPGKYYKVTADVIGRSGQDFEICYNNGGAEMGYDSMGGLRLTAGKAQTVEKLISVPADKTDASNLMLQFNLGKATTTNAVTVSGVKVEEVTLTYADMIPQGLNYAAGAVKIWTDTDCTATLEGSANSATAHITSVPANGAEVWKVKMLVSTGAILQAGKSYVVRADMLSAKAQGYEVCYNNEETEKGFDALYGQSIAAGTKTTIEKRISVPASMTDAGELILQLSVGGPTANDITVSNVSVQELNFGASSGDPVPDTVISLYNAPRTAAGTLDVTREKLTYKMTKISAESKDNAVTIAGASLRAEDRYTVSFTAKADKELTGAFTLDQGNGKAAVISEQFKLTPENATYSFTTKDPLTEGGAYDLLWRFGSAEGQKLGSADVEISDIKVSSPAETLNVAHSPQNVTVNGKVVKPDIYSINGYNYFKLRDLAALMNDTDGQFVVRYNSKSDLISLTTGKSYTPTGTELTIGADMSASCARTPQNVAVNGEAVDLKAYNIGGYNYFKLRDLNELLGFKVDYAAETNTVVIASPLTPEAQEKAHAYDIFFLPEIDGESQAYVGDTMPFYDNGVYYIYYLKEGGDSYNHSVYVTSTKDFVHYTEHDDPVLSASREDVQDNWIGTGSVVKVDETYYFFYTGFNASGSQEYHEKIMVAKSSSPTGTFEKMTGWEIVPPAELGQKNDFRDPQAYYDPATQTISLTVTSNQEGKARILKYTLGKDLQNAKYDGIIFTDQVGFFNLECSDTFQIGNKWYLTYSGQDDTLWYAMADSRFGPYSAPVRLDGKLFYAAKHVEDGQNIYMVGWARRSNSASSTQEVNGWGGNVTVQKLHQQQDGSLALVPVDSIVSTFGTQVALGATEASLTAGSSRAYKAAFTSGESFMLKGEFTYSGTGSFGLAFDFNGMEDRYKLVSIDPSANKLSLSLDGGAVPITETKAALCSNEKHSFTYIQDGSVGIFYLDGQAALTVRVYGATDKPIYLFAENNNVTFTSLQQYTR